MPTDTSPIASVPLQPWQRSWFWHARSELPTMVWVLGIHLVALAGLILLPLPPWPVFAVALGLLALGGLGTTVAYHRSLAHTATRLALPVEQFLILCAMLNGSGRPRTWVSNHRHHHRYSDKDGDISSPAQGFWWSHLRWLWQAEQPHPDRFCPDLDRLRYRIWDRLQIPILALSLFGGLAWLCVADWPTALAAGLWIGPIRLIWALHAQCSVNSVCHLGEETAEGTSRNVLWLAPFHLFQGENWHANHHRRPATARIGDAWWQIDLGWVCLRALAGMRLATRPRQG